MRTQQELVEGWTAPLEFQLIVIDPLTNLSSNFDLTGLATPKILAHNQSGISLPLVGAVAVLDAVSGKLRYTPDAADLKFASGPYFVRFEITDTNNKLAYFPNDAAMEWIIRK